RRESEGPGWGPRCRTLPPRSLANARDDKSDVPLHPLQLCALDRALAKEAREIRLLEAQQVAHRRGAVFVAGDERRMRLGGMRVPRTDLLADVASEDVAVERPIDRAAMLDRQVADASLRRDRSIRQDRIGRTGIDASRARAAAIGNGRRANVVRLRGQERPDEKVRAA